MQDHVSPWQLFEDSRRLASVKFHLIGRVELAYFFSRKCRGVTHGRQFKNNTKDSQKISSPGNFAKTWALLNEMIFFTLYLKPSS